MAGVWSGFLTFGLVTLPVRLFSGARGERIGFHLLHAKDHVRLKQQMYCPADEEVVPRDETVRGYEYAKGEYVVIEDEEIKKVAPRTEKQMEIIEFCQADEIDPIWFESSYYLMPEAAGKKPYALLERAMEESGYVAIAKLSMHNREYLSLIRPSRLAGVPVDGAANAERSGAPGEDGAGDGKRGAKHKAAPQLEHSHGGLVLHTLYYADEIRVAEGFAESAEQEPKEAELKLARQLIEGLAQPFDPTRFEDTYRKNLEELIAAKVEGKPIHVVDKPKLAPVTDLMETLKRSLEQMPKKGAASETPTKAAARTGKSKKRVA